MDFHHPFFKECLLNHTAEEILKIVAPFVTKNKKEKIESVLKNRLSSVHIAMESPSNIHNALATVRSAEAFGIYNMHLIAPENIDRKRRGRKTTQGAYRWVNVSQFEDNKSFVNCLRNRGVSLYGAALTGDSLLDKLPVDKPFCLVFGNEERGLSEDMLSYCDKTYKIPMYGMVESFNVSVCAAISLYELTTKIRRENKSLLELSRSEELAEKAWYYVRACGIDLTRKLLLQKTK